MWVHTSIPGNIGTAKVSLDYCTQTPTNCRAAALWLTLTCEPPEGVAREKTSSPQGTTKYKTFLWKWNFFAWITPCLQAFEDFCNIQRLWKFSVCEFCWRDAMQKYPSTTMSLFEVYTFDSNANIVAALRTRNQQQMNQGQACCEVTCWWVREAKDHTLLFCRLCP